MEYVGGNAQNLTRLIVDSDGNALKIFGLVIVRV
jgi:hypothetical protein